MTPFKKMGIVSFRLLSIRLLAKNKFVSSHLLNESLSKKLQVTESQS